MKLVLFIHWWWHNEVAQYFGKYVEKSCKNSYILWCSFFHFGDLLFRKRYCVPMVFTTELLRVKIQKQEQRSRKLVGASQVVLMVKNPPANTGDARDAGSIPGWGRSPGEGHGNPLQYSYLENPMDRGAWWAIVHRVSKSRKQLKWLSLQRTGYKNDGKSAPLEPRGCRITSSNQQGKFIPEVRLIQ